MEGNCVHTQVNCPPCLVKHQALLLIRKGGREEAEERCGLELQGGGAGEGAISPDLLPEAVASSWLHGLAGLAHSVCTSFRASPPQT